jgi:hypothetical protein
MTTATVPLHRIRIAPTPLRRLAEARDAARQKWPEHATYLERVIDAGGSASYQDLPGDEQRRVNMLSDGLIVQALDGSLMLDLDKVIAGRPKREVDYPFVQPRAGHHRSITAFREWARRHSNIGEWEVDAILDLQANEFGGVCKLSASQLTGAAITALLDRGLIRSVPLPPAWGRGYQIAWDKIHASEVRERVEIIVGGEVIAVG